MIYSTTADARFNIKAKVPVNTRQVIITHARGKGEVGCLLRCSQVRLLNERGKKSVVWVRCVDGMENVRVRGDPFYSLFWPDIWVVRRSIELIGNPRDMPTLGLKSYQCPSGNSSASSSGLVENIKFYN